MSHSLDAAYWNDRYLHNDSGWDAGAITPPLKAYIDQLENKEISILIPGAGNAYEAEYLLNEGFSNLYVCDFAEQPLKNLQQRCPAMKRKRLLQVDFFEIRHSQFDLILEQTFFCALHPSLRKAYFEKIHALLKPGGKLVGLLFNDALTTDGPPFGGTKEEYIPYFKDLFEAKVFDACYNSIKPRQWRELFMILEKKS